MKATYFLPQRAFSPIDAYNRAALATGSTRNAMVASHADYNGHWYRVIRTIRGQWNAGYTWAGWHVIARGDIGSALDAAIEGYNRGALGSSVECEVYSDEDIAECVKRGLVEKTDESFAASRSWYTWKHEVANELGQRNNSLHVFFDAPFLDVCLSKEEYYALLRSKARGQFAARVANAN